MYVIKKKTITFIELIFSKIKNLFLQLCIKIKLNEKKLRVIIFSMQNHKLMFIIISTKIYKIIYFFHFICDFIFKIKLKIEYNFNDLNYF